MRNFKRVSCLLALVLLVSMSGGALAATELSF